jgi:hypothetical protein
MTQVSDQREKFRLIPTIPLYWDASLRNDSVDLSPSLRMRDASLNTKYIESLVEFYDPFNYRFTRGMQRTISPPPERLNWLRTSVVGWLLVSIEELQFYIRRTIM